MPSQEFCERVLEAVIAAAARDAESMDLLRFSVREFTIALRTQGATPEAALIALKTLVGARGGQPVGRSLTDWSGYILRETMSKWCIDEYFTEAPAPYSKEIPNER